MCTCTQLTQKHTKRRNMPIMCSVDGQGLTYCAINGAMQRLSDAGRSPGDHSIGTYSPLTRVHADVQQLTIHMKYPECHTGTGMFGVVWALDGLDGGAERPRRLAQF